jgi:hypothetical protein
MNVDPQFVVIKETFLVDSVFNRINYQYNMEISGKCDPGKGGRTCECDLNQHGVSTAAQLDDRCRV